MSKSLRQKIIERLNKGFGLKIPEDTPWFTHMNRRSDAFSWWLDGFGSCESATKVMKWKRWVAIDSGNGEMEICEYNEKDIPLYEKHRYFLIEK